MCFWEGRTSLCHFCRSAILSFLGSRNRTHFHLIFGLISDSQNHQKHVKIVVLLSLPTKWILRRVHNVFSGRYDDLLINLSLGHFVILGPWNWSSFSDRFGSSRHRNRIVGHRLFRLVGHRLSRPVSTSESSRLGIGSSRLVIGIGIFYLVSGIILSRPGIGIMSRY